MLHQTAYMENMNANELNITLSTHLHQIQKGQDVHYQ